MNRILTILKWALGFFGGIMSSFLLVSLLGLIFKTRWFGISADGWMGFIGSIIGTLLSALTAYYIAYYFYNKDLNNTKESSKKATINNYKIINKEIETALKHGVQFLEDLSSEKISDDQIFIASQFVLFHLNNTSIDLKNLQIDKFEFDVVDQYYILKNSVEKMIGFFRYFNIGGDINELRKYLKSIDEYFNQLIEDARSAKKYLDVYLNI
ncbi:hypothetical protein ABWW58_02490 [Sporolactobacillus sp. STCC-11]|uniref:hypothetical protein n=1 Tax=Sporolactobacillus caesalpiniae TaxID=3230362 RepID=UPI0033965082